MRVTREVYEEETYTMYAPSYIFRESLQDIFPLWEMFAKIQKTTQETLWPVMKKNHSTDLQPYLYIAKFYSGSRDSAYEKMNEWRCDVERGKKRKMLRVFFLSLVASSSVRTSTFIPQFEYLWLKISRVWRGQTVGVSKSQVIERNLVFFPLILRIREKGDKTRIWTMNGWRKYAKYCGRPLNRPKRNPNYILNRKMW